MHVYMYSDILYNVYIYIICTYAGMYIYICLCMYGTAVYACTYTCTCMHACVHLAPQKVMLHVYTYIIICPMAYLCVYRNVCVYMP